MSIFVDVGVLCNSIRRTPRITLKFLPFLTRMSRYMHLLMHKIIVKFQLSMHLWEVAFWLIWANAPIIQNN
jgi:hypothetical protein